MVLTAFNPDVTIASILTGGAKSVDRALVNFNQQGQVTAANSIEALFQARLDAKNAVLASPATNAVTDALLRQQSLLVSRKDRLANATSFLSKALTQIEFLKTHTKHLSDQLLALEAGSITAAEVATDFDNKLRKINILISDAQKTVLADGGTSYKTNLINSLSRETFITDSLLAPYNFQGDSLFIEGIYLGNDYFITDSDGSGNVFYSDIGFRANESDTGILTEYSSFPDTVVSTAAEAGLDLTASVSDSDVTFDTANETGINGSITRGGLGLLDAWLYDRFNNATDIDRAQADLESAESKLLLAEASFKSDLVALQSRESLFDAMIGGLETEIESEIKKLQDERQADLLAAQFEFDVARFQFALLASRGNTLVVAMLLSQDFAAFTFKTNTQTAKAVTGSLVSVDA